MAAHRRGREDQAAMKQSASHGSDALIAADPLILAVDESTAGVGKALLALARDGHPAGDAQTDGARKFVVSGAGDALRLIHRREPQIVCVCVGAGCAEASAAMIDALHRRRPRLPVLAVAADHDETIERAVRAAGVNYYFALSNESDSALLRDALQTHTTEPGATHSGLSPPLSGKTGRCRGQAVSRPRPRYGRSSFD